jgi:hypothetical protein
VEQGIAAAVERLDIPSVSERYRTRNEFVFLEDFLLPETVAALAARAEALSRFITRRHLPGYKKSGSVVAYAIRHHAPEIVAMYRAPALLALMRALTDKPLVHCPDDDPHACALYYYTEPGDRMGPHVDRCAYQQGSCHTVLVPVVDDSSARLMCEPFYDVPGRAETLMLTTRPGSVVIFNGCNNRHSVTPIRAGERRIVLSMSFVTDPTTGWRRTRENIKDAIAYFGFKSVFLRGRGVPD